jgi:hypothetical protein
VKPYLEKTHHKKTKQNKRTVGVAQGVGPEFKLQYCKTKQQKTNNHHRRRVAGEEAQVIGCLPSKHKVLNSTPSRERERERGHLDRKNSGKGLGTQIVRSEPGASL